MGVDRQYLFYGLDDDLRIGLVFYGGDCSVDGMVIFYRPVVDTETGDVFIFSCGRDDIF